MVRKGKIAWINTGREKKGERERESERGRGEGDADACVSNADR